MSVLVLVTDRTKLVVVFIILDVIFFQKMKVKVKKPRYFYEENIILMEEIGKLRDEIKDLKQTINR